jgi:hypothetical protein
MARRSTAQKLKLPVLGIFRSFAVVGVEPAIMGVGPAYAIPAAVQKAGLTFADIDVFEINEAFASQATYCIKHLNLPAEKVFFALHFFFFFFFKLFWYPPAPRIAVALILLLPLGQPEWRGHRARAPPGLHRRSNDCHPPPRTQAQKGVRISFLRIACYNPNTHAASLCDCAEVSAAAMAWCPCALAPVWALQRSMRLKTSQM